MTRRSSRWAAGWERCRGNGGWEGHVRAVFSCLQEGLYLYCTSKRPCGLSAGQHGSTVVGGWPHASLQNACCATHTSVLAPLRPPLLRRCAPPRPPWPPLPLHQACATPRCAVFGIFNPFETPQNQQQQMETPTPRRVSLGRQQPISCPPGFTLGVDGEQGTGVGGQGATEEVEVLSADGAAGVAGGEVQQRAGELGVGVCGADRQMQGAEAEEAASRRAESSASLASACLAAASPKGYSLFGTGAVAGRFGPHLLRTATKLSAVSKACPAAASREGGFQVAGANSLEPWRLAGGSAAPSTYGSGSGCSGVAAPSHCHVAQPAAHACTNVHRQTAGAGSQLHVARQPDQEAALFAILRSPLHTPLGLRARLPPTRSACTSGGGSAMGRRCGGGGC